MTDPLNERDEAAAALEMVARAARPYLDSLNDLPVHDHAAGKLLEQLDGEFPEHGEGTLSSVERLLRVGTGAATHSSGPRFFHFVVGGVHPGGAGRRLAHLPARPDPRAWADARRSPRRARDRRAAAG